MRIIRNKYDNCRRVYRRYKEYSNYHPEDMKKILEFLREHGEILVEEGDIERLYEEFSCEKYSAGWLSVDDQILFEFEDWLNEYEY